MSERTPGSEQSNEGWMVVLYVSVDGDYDKAQDLSVELEKKANNLGAAGVFAEINERLPDDAA